MAAIEASVTRPAPALAAPNKAPAKPSTDEPLASVRWSRGYAMTPDGGFVYTPPGDDAVTTFLSGYFVVLGRCRDELSGSWGLAIAFDDYDGVTKTLILPTAELVGEAAGVLRNLADAGLKIAARKAGRDRLIEALIAVSVDGRVRIVFRTEWTSDCGAFVLPDRTIGGAERTVIAGATASAKIGTRGTPDSWSRMVAARAAPHTHFVFALSVALASPLLALVGSEGAIFHWLGRSSTGKSTVLAAAASVWGPPGFTLSWRGTSNGFEGIAALHSDLCLILDELGIADPKTVGDTVYMLVNAATKSRMRSDGSVKPVISWRIFVLSTGETSLEAKLAEDGRRNLVGGQTVRFIALKIDPSSPSGACDGRRPPEYYAAEVKAIKAGAAEHFGTSGPAFLERLVTDHAAAAAFARATVGRFVETNVPAGADGQVARVAAKFGLVAAAGELATTWTILPFKPGACEAAAGRLFKSWLRDRGGDGPTEDAQAIARVREFLQAHASARLPLINEASDRISVSFRVQMLAGYRDQQWFYLTDGGFKEALGGLDPAGAADALHRAGYLAKGDGNRRKAYVSTPDGRQRLYNISRAILEHDDGS